MELPHLTLYLRRLAAPVDWRRPLASARGRWWISGLVWFAASLILLACWPWLSSPPRIYIEWLGVAIALVGNGATYLVVTSTAAGLAGELSSNPRKSQATGEPVWWSTPLPNMQAVLGVAATAVLAGLPIAVGSVCLLLLSFTLTSVPSDWAFQTWPEFLLPNVASILRLPQLALAAGAVAIAFRGTVLKPVLPALMTTAAVLGAVADPLLSQWGSLEYPGGLSDILATIALLGVSTALLATLMNVLLVNGSGGWRPQFAALLVIAVCCGGPALLGVLGLAPNFTGSANALVPPAGSAVMHAFASSYLPDLQPLELSSASWDSEGPVLAGHIRGTKRVYTVRFYGWTVGCELGLLLGITLYFLSLAFWFFTAVRCLDAARGIGRRPLQAEVQPPPI